MPRSYSYDHFQVPKREPNERSGSPDIVKAAVKKQKDTAGRKKEELPPVEAASGLHYGHGHSETIERYQRARKNARTRPQKKTASRGASPRPEQVAAKKQAAPKQAAPKEKAEAPARPTRTRTPAAGKPLVGPLLVAGVKVVARAAAAAKRTVKTVAKKSPLRKSPKKR
jgi:hypothetical protein